LRSELPGIATNLLADRLRALEAAGLICRTEMPPPIARTVYQLSDAGWRKFTPVLQTVANFGIDQFDVNAAHTPLNGFLAGLLLGFDPSHAADIRASYRVKVDGRTFDFSVDGGELTAGRDAVAVTVEATADHRPAGTERSATQGSDSTHEIRWRRRCGGRIAAGLPTVSLKTS
jgi:hypothetical protein